MKDTDKLSFIKISWMDGSIKYNQITVMILSFRTDRSGQTVQTQIRLLPEEQSEQGLHCYSICIFLTKYTKLWVFCFNFR